MQVTIDIPDTIAAEVQARGLTIESYLQEPVVSWAVTAKGELVVSWAATPKPRLVRLGPGPYTPEEAGRNIRDLRKGARLNGLKIKDLIEEGRRI